MREIVLAKSQIDHVITSELLLVPLKAHSNRHPTANSSGKIIPF